MLVSSLSMCFNLLWLLSLLVHSLYSCGMLCKCLETFQRVGMTEDAWFSGASSPCYLWLWYCRGWCVVGGEGEAKDKTEISTTLVYAFHCLCATYCWLLLNYWLLAWGSCFTWCSSNAALLQKIPYKMPSLHHLVLCDLSQHLCKSNPARIRYSAS